MFCSFHVSFPVSVWLTVFPFPQSYLLFTIVNIHIPHTEPKLLLIWEEQGREKSRDLLYCVLSLLFQFLHKKMVPGKIPTADESTEKKKKTFASQPAQSLVRCQDGKFIIWGSEWSPPAMTQNWRKSDPSPPLKFTTEIIKVLAIFFLISFSLIFWFSGFHAWPFLWPLLLSSNRYPEINLLELFYSSVLTETDSLSPCFLLKVTFPHSYGDSNSAT